MGGRALGSCRIALAALTLAAIAAQFADGAADPPFHVVRFFSFFTIESNLLAAGVLLVSGAGALRGRPPSERLDMWRGAATLYMATTGIVYSALLAGQSDSLLAWTNLVVHYVMPVALMLDWAIDRPRWRIPFRRALVWMAFPVAFIAYSLVRGAVVDWYPYLFVDVGEHGYPAVVATSAVLGVAMLGMIWLLAWTTALGGRRALPEPAR